MKNLSNIALPTVEEIQSYHAGMLPDARCREIELLALEHPLVADAIEGFGEIPAYTKVPVSMVKPVKPALWKTAGWFSAGIASVAIGVFLYQGKGESPVEVAETTQVEQLSEHEAVQVEQMKLADATRPEAEQKPARQTAERKMQPAADTARVVQPGTQSIPKQQASITVKKEGELFIWPEVVKEDGVVLKHINNYKVVDYGAMRHDKWVPFDADLPGTSADRENPETPPHTAEPEIKVPYLRYIQDCIEAFYKGETNRCLQHFATVLQQYPDDVNAQFYSAMCFYKKGDYAKAIKFYDQSLANDTRTFGEESLYYKAMSLKNSGKTKEANDLFTYIVNGNGYYRKQAEAELKAQN